MHQSFHDRHSARRRAVLELRSRQHRLAPTPSEALLWRELVSGKLGVSFRRQVVIGGRFIVDFVAPSIGLVVEVDGGWHRERRRADARRDEKLRRLGYRVLRVEADLVERNLARAVGLVRGEIERLRG
jgi:very-short-patch-repair endonuclease